MDLLSLEVLYYWGYTRQFAFRVYLFLQANLSGSYPQHSFQIVRICIAVLHMEGGNFLESVIFLYHEGPRIELGSSRLAAEAFT